MVATATLSSAIDAAVHTARFNRRPLSVYAVAGALACPDSTPELYAQVVQLLCERCVTNGVIIEFASAPPRAGRGDSRSMSRSAPLVADGSHLLRYHRDLLRLRARVEAAAENPRPAESTEELLYLRRQVSTGLQHLHRVRFPAAYAEQVVRCSGSHQALLARIDAIRKRWLMARVETNAIQDDKPQLPRGAA